MNEAALEIISLSISPTLFIKMNAAQYRFSKRAPSSLSTFQSFYLWLHLNSPFPRFPSQSLPSKHGESTSKQLTHTRKLTLTNQPTQLKLLKQHPWTRYVNYKLTFKSGNGHEETGPLPVSSATNPSPVAYVLN